MLGRLHGSPHRDSLLPCSLRSTLGSLGSLRGAVTPRLHTAAAPSSTGSRTLATVAPAAPATPTGARVASRST